MLINCVEISLVDASKRSYSLKNVLVNTEHIVCAREDEEYGKFVFESDSLKDLDKRTKFTRLSLNRGNMGYEIVIAGPLEKLEKEIEKRNKTLLKG